MPSRPRVTWISRGSQFVADLLPRSKNAREDPAFCRVHRRARAWRRRGLHGHRRGGAQEGRQARQKGRQEAGRAQACREEGARQEGGGPLCWRLLARVRHRRDAAARALRPAQPARPWPRGLPPLAGARDQTRTARDGCDARRDCDRGWDPPAWVPLHLGGHQVRRPAGHPRRRLLWHPARRLGADCRLHRCARRRRLPPGPVQRPRRRGAGPADRLGAVRRPRDQGLQAQRRAQQRPRCDVWHHRHDLAHRPRPGRALPDRLEVGPPSARRPPAGARGSEARGGRDGVS